MAVITVPTSAIALAIRTFLSIKDVQKAVSIRRTRERFVPEARWYDVHAYRWLPVCVLARPLNCRSMPLPRQSEAADGVPQLRSQSAII